MHLIQFVTFGTAGGCAPNCLVGFGNAVPTEVIATFGSNKRDSSAGVLSADGQSQCVHLLSPFLWMILTSVCGGV